MFGAWGESTTDDSSYEEASVASVPTLRSEESMSRELTKSDGSRGGTASALRGMFSQWIALLLICSPIAFVLHLFGDSVAPVWDFLANMGAIIPLSWVISESTEHLETVVGPMWGTLLNSTFGNVVEIILSIQAIRAGLVKMVQAMLLGAILMNTTGVLGLCVIAVGCRERSKKFNFNFAIYNLGLLSIAMVSLVVPTELTVFDDWSSPAEITRLSRWVAGMLLFMYIQWLIFNLWTHSQLFTSKAKPKHEALEVVGNLRHWSEEMEMRHMESMEDVNGARKGLIDAEAENGDLLPDDEEEEETIAAPCAILMLLVATVFVAFHCDYLVESIEPLTEELGVKKAFIATILLPMVGNFSEVIAAVSIAWKGKIDLAIGVAIGSASQIALCVIPIAVFIGWACGTDLNLDFETFQVKLLTVSILVVVLVLLDGRVNWLKGSLLLTVYVILSSAFFFLHDREFESAGMEHSELIASLNSSLQELNSTVEALADKVHLHH